MMPSLRELGEDLLLAQILPKLKDDLSVIAGAGDDCAVVKFRDATGWLMLKTDCVVEGVHFGAGVSARAVGWKAMMRALSDFAAMSGVPRFALITLVIAGKKHVTWVRDLYRGLTRAARYFKVSMVGGETSDTAGPTIVVVSAAGFVEPNRCVWRSGGKNNDDLFVTGKLGGSIRRRHLNFVARIEEARWLTANFKLHAMMDVSDGLGADLPRLAQASGLAFSIDERALPVSRGCTAQQAICDGEDYELLFAISPRDRTRLEGMWRRKFPKLRLTRIGRLRRKSKNEDQAVLRGYVHFRQRG